MFGVIFDEHSQEMEALSKKGKCSEAAIERFRTAKT